MQGSHRDTRHSELRVAIIGAGFISDYHISGLRAAGGATITHLIGRRPDRTAERAAALKIERYGTDYEDVLKEESVDAVVIATPDFTHKAIATEALKAGKAVLLQKPMAMTSAECREIIAASEASGASLTTSFMHRYFPEVRWLRARIAERAFGPIHFVRIRNATPGADWADWFFRPEQVAGGVVMQLGVHGIDLVQHLFGPIASLSATTRTVKSRRRLADGREVISALEDNAHAAYEMAAGFTASHEMSATEVAGCDRFRLEVYFEEATVWLRSGPAAALVNRGKVSGKDAWKPVDFAGEPLGQAHHAHWLNVVRGTEPTDGTAAAGLSTLIVAEGIYRSAHEETRLKIASESVNG
jgi:predicted dehydrogenase